MKKALVFFGVLFTISLLVSIVSGAICGGELIKTGVEYGIEQYHEYKAENPEGILADLDFSIDRENI